MEIFLNKLKALQSFIDNQAPEIVGQEAVSHFRASFRNEGFTDRSLARWADVKRRTNPRDKSKAAALRPILTGATGDLGNSIRCRRTTGGVEIYSDKVYAEVHNTGGRAGRGKGFTMPKRQFIGQSQALIRSTNKHIAAHINRTFK